MCRRLTNQAGCDSHLKVIVDFYDGRNFYTSSRKQIYWDVQLLDIICILSVKCLVFLNKDITS